MAQVAEESPTMDANDGFFECPLDGLFGLSSAKVRVCYLSPCLNVMQTMVERMEKMPPTALANSDGHVVIELTRAISPKERAGGRGSSKGKKDMKINQIFGVCAVKTEHDEKAGHAHSPDEATDPKADKEKQKQIKSMKLFAKHLLS